MPDLFFLKVGAGDHTRVFMLARQTLYLLSHVLSLSCSFPGVPSQERTPVHTRLNQVKQDDSAHPTVFSLSAFFRFSLRC